jgi:hypothetical protein
VDSSKTTAGGINTLLEFENCRYPIREGSIGSEAITDDSEEMLSSNSKDRLMAA